MRSEITQLSNYSITRCDLSVSDHFANLVLDNRLNDLPRILLPSQECFSKVHRLLQLDLPGQRWFVLIHHGFDHRRTVMLKSFPKHALRFLWITNGEPSSARGLRIFRKVDRLKIYSELRIRVEHHLLPLNLS